jgi:hypothetical protein
MSETKGVTSGIQAYQAMKETKNFTEEEPKGFIDHVIKDPLKNMIASQHTQESAMAQALEGNLSEDELGMLITQAELYLKEVKAVSDRLVQVVHETSHAVGG